MVIKIVFSVTLLLGLAAPAPGAEPRRSSQAQEQVFHERATLLRSQIAVGWSPEDVARIMGGPEHVGRRADGGDSVETWWYHGFQVGIEFRRGAVSNWFFRFMK